MTFPVLRHITVIQGQSLASEVFFLSRQGTPYDLSGGDAHMSVKEKPSDTSTLLNLTVANGGIIQDEFAGTLTLNGSHAAIAALDPVVARYDLFWTDSAGKRWPIAYGIFTVQAAQTGDP